MEDKQQDATTGLTRRDLFRLGTCGACGLMLSGVPGSARQARAQSARKGFIRTFRSPLFTAEADNHVRCDLCPLRCRIAPGERGRCQVRENRDGRGYSLVYGNPCVVQVNPIERVPFFHVVPESRSLSVATAGCNLSCKFCEVWETALASPEEVHAYDMGPAAIVKTAEESKVRSIAYTFGEPVVFYEFMARTAVRARRAGILNLFHSAGYIRPDPLRRLAEYLDAANIDLKGWDEEFYRDVVGGERAPVLETLQILKEADAHLEITVPLIPSLNDDMEQIGEMVRWIMGELGPDVPVHFSRFHPLYKLANLPSTPVSTLTRAREVAREAGLRYVYIARVPGHEAANTFCAHCDERVIARVGFMIREMHIDDGKCGHCGGALPGIWA